MLAIIFSHSYAFLCGLWIGLLPYMLLRYLGCDLFGNGTYRKER